MNTDCIDLPSLLASAEAARRCGDLAEAEAILDRAIAAVPGERAALHAAGNVAQAQGRHDRALDFFSRAVSPDLAGHIPAAYHLSHAAALGRLGRAGPALAAADRAIAADPDFAEAHFARGVALEKLGRADESLAALRRALAGLPDHPDVLAAVGTALAKMPDIASREEAVRHLSRAIHLRPANVGALNTLGPSGSAPLSCANGTTILTDAVAPKRKIHGGLGCVNSGHG